MSALAARVLRWLLNILVPVPRTRRTPNDRSSE